LNTGNIKKKIKCEKSQAIFFDFPHIMVHNSKTVKNRENLTGDFRKLIKFSLRKVDMQISINVH